MNAEQENKFNELIRLERALIDARRTETRAEHARIACEKELNKALEDFKLLYFEPVEDSNDTMYRQKVVIKGDYVYFLGCYPTKKSCTLNVYKAEKL